MTFRFAVAWCLAASACFSPVAEPCRSKTRCPADAGGDACSVGSTRECGSAVGICKPGRQTCASDGTWGKCSGGVEPGVEVCDGKDNNCDGVVDDGVAKTCPLQKGVCAGAQAACGGDAGCVQAYGPLYEAIELKCDGLDNDCDGFVDRTKLINISQSPGVVSRRAVAARVPGSEAVVVLYEEGSKVAARVLRADGTLSDAVAPAVTVEAVTRAWAPAIAVNGSLIVAAWAEEVPAAKRVMVASLDPTTGRSSLMGAGALLAITATAPTDVAVGVDQAAGKLMVAVVDTTGIRLVGFASTLPPPMGSPTYTVDPFDRLGRRPSLSPATGGAFLLGYDETDGRLERTVVGVPPDSSEALQPMGQNANLFLTDAGTFVSYYLGGSSTSKQVLSSRCNFGGGVACTTAVPLNTLGDLDALRVAEARLFAWQNGVASPHVVQAWLTRMDAGVDLAPGRRPMPIVTPTYSVTFFDTESVVSSVVDPDEVYVVKTCAP